MHILHMILNVINREQNDKVTYIYEKDLEVSHQFPVRTAVEYRSFVGTVTDLFYSVNDDIVVMNVEFVMYYNVDSLSSIREQLVDDFWTEIV